ncbi:MAG: hypothetical protein KL863_05670 [Rhizobium sp.]|nr:hypothetical protein [Rhizobium sp.]
MLRNGFEHDHDPLMRIAHVVAEGAIASTFPQMKFTTAMPKLKRPLAVEAAIHFMTDPSVSKVSLYPIEVPLDRKPHIVEFGLLRTDGRISYVDVIPLLLQQEFGWIGRRTKQLKAEVARLYGASYAVLDERDLWIEPRRANLRTMFSHLGSDDAVALGAVRDVIHHIPMPATIAEVRSAAGLEPFDFVYFDNHGHPATRERLENVDRTFTALMELAANGEVDIDLSHKFNNRTTVWLSGVHVHETRV